MGKVKAMLLPLHLLLSAAAASVVGCVDVSDERAYTCGVTDESGQPCSASDERAYTCAVSDESGPSCTATDEQSASCVATDERLCP